MKFYVILGLIGFCFQGLAQNVGIGTASPHTSAQLEVSASNKGLLIPRMSSSNREGIMSPAKGLLIFDIDTSTFWYFNGNIWVNMNTAISPNGWSLTGNIGTNPSLNFIGTLDDLPLKFKINNTAAGEVNSQANTALGLNASILSGGSQNTAIGAFSLANNAGIFNTALGFSSLYSNLSGNSNVALGTHAAYNSTNKSNIVAVGDSALYNNGTDLSPIGGEIQGIGNTAVGSKTLLANKVGSYNTAIGYHSQKSSVGAKNNTSLGYRSLADGTGGVNNTAVGIEVLKNNDGWFNTGVGSAALFNNSNGYYNTGLGTAALSNVISGNYNTGVGYLANVALGTHRNATAIGAFALADCSDCVVLGGVNGVNGASAHTKVGIGVLNPNASLAVARGDGFDGTAVFAGTTYNSHFNYGGAEGTYLRGGKAFSPVFINDGIAGHINLGGSGDVNINSNKMFAPQTGSLNLVPLGIVSMAVTFLQDGTFVSESHQNIVGAVYQNWTYTTTTTGPNNGQGTRDFELRLNHNPSAIAGYSNIITIGDANFSSSFYQTLRARKSDWPGYTKFEYTTQNVLSSQPYTLRSTFMVYGIR